MSGTDRIEGGSAPHSRRLEIRVLGPFELVWDGAVVEVGGLKARALLARLLIDRNLVVSGDQLAESLWGDEDAADAHSALRSTISRVRKRLRAASAPDGCIVTRAPGYLLDVPASITDAFRFEQLVATARGSLSAARAGEALRLLGEAEDLWRGAAYREVRDESFARAEARRLEELRLAATEVRIDAALGVGRHEELTGELEGLTSAHPLRERLWSQRMLALYRSGRQAEALRVFQDLRAILVAELGIEPGTDVTRMEHAILTHEPALDFAAIEPSVTSGDDVQPRRPTATAGYRVPASSAPDETPFVGRERESALLREWWASALGGEKRLMLVDGEAGVGKTRLVTQLVREAEAEGELVLWGRCDEGPIVPFQPFAEVLGRVFDLTSADRISNIPRWRLSELSRLVVRLREHAPAVEDVGAAPEAERYRFFEAVAATFKELGIGGRVLVVFDDLHWADQPTLLLLRHVLRALDRTNVAIIGVYTDTEVPAGSPMPALVSDLRTTGSIESVHLSGLGADAVEELARGSSKIPSELLPRLCELTGGNPLFLDELLGQFRAREDEGDESGASSLPDLTPTETIRELVARRVSRLPEDVVHVLQTAAVAGPDSEARVIAEAVELTPERRLDAIDLLWNTRLLRQSTDSDPPRFTFSNALIRDAIYSEMPWRERVRAHHRIAVAVEHVHADSHEDHLGELAHHFYLGSGLADADRALRYSLAAAERASRMLAYEEAVEHFTRCLRLLHVVRTSDTTTRYDVLLALGQAQQNAGDMAAADENLARAATLARGLHDVERLATAALYAGPPSYLGLVRPTEEQVGTLRDAWEQLPKEDSRLRAMVAARLAVAEVTETALVSWADIERSRDLTSDAVAMARRLKDRGTLGFALSNHLRLLWGPEAAAERLATAVELGEIAEETGSERLALAGHMWRVRELLVRGDVDAVDEEIARFDAGHTGPVHPLEVAFSGNAAAMLALMRGQFVVAESSARQAEEAAREYHDLARNLYAAVMWWTWWQRGELSRPDHELREAVAQAPDVYPAAYGALALAQAESGEADEAVAALRSFLDLEYPGSSVEMSLGHELTIAAAACGSLRTPPREISSRIYEGMRPLAGTVIVMRPPAMACAGPADQYLGVLAATMGDLALAEVHFEAALSLARRMRAPTFEVAAEVALARTLGCRRPEAEAGRVAQMLRHAEESALVLGLHRLVGLAIESC